MRKAADKAGGIRTVDSFQNFAAGLGIGTDNISSGGTYGFLPISRVRTLLEWIHRGSWLGGVAIDLVAQDMTRGGVDIRGDVETEDIEHLERTAHSLGLWNSICDVVKASRLYGGAIGVLLVDGQRMDTPLRPETVGKGQFKGMVALDRWSVEPSLSDLITEPGPNIGLPKFYTVNTEYPALRGQKIHYSRCLRLVGIKLPYWQAVMENLWGISVLERIYDRMLAFDSATQGMAQLVYKCWFRTLSIENLREIVASGSSPALKGLMAQVQMMRQMQSTEGISLLDMKDKLEVQQVGSMTGLAEAVTYIGQQLCGALQIPQVRMFGVSPAGLNSTGEADLRTYYDNIKQSQEQDLRVPVTNAYVLMMRSEGIKVPEGFTLDFRSLWVLSDNDKAAIAAQDSTNIQGLVTAGIYDPPTALREIRQLSKVTGRGTNITDQAIEQAEANWEEQQEMQRAEQELALAGGEQEFEQSGEEGERAEEAHKAEMEDRKDEKGDKAKGASAKGKSRSKLKVKVKVKPNGKAKDGWSGLTVDALRNSHKGPMYYAGEWM